MTHINQQPTLVPELNRVLVQLTEHVQTILADKLIGVYLQGSFAVGDWDNDSDVDFVVAIETDLIDDEIAQLNAMHKAFTEQNVYWAQHLEGAYFPRKWLANPYANQHALWYVDNGSPQLERSLHDNTLVVRWVLYEHGITLYGDDVRDVFAPVLVDALCDEVRAVMREWGDDLLSNPDVFVNYWYQQFIVLSYCRMLQTLATGKVLSKSAGAQWGMDHLDAKWTPLIQKAQQKRKNQFKHSTQPEGDPDDAAQVEAFLRYVLSKIEA